jgi:hypothetical protein
MAEITFMAPVETIKGKLHDRDKTIFRRKRVFDDKGHVIGHLSQEAYIVKNPRNWKKNPPKGAEKQRHDNWAAACQQAANIRKDPEQLVLWKQRWAAQLQCPEPDAPIDKNTGRPKIYIRLDGFIRATLFRELQKS